MRVSLPTTILALATALAWLGWSAKPTEAGAPGMAQITDKVAPTNQGEMIAPGQVITRGESQGQGPMLGQGSFLDQEQCQEPIDGCACGGPCGPRWTFTAEAIVLERTTTRSVPLFVPTVVDPKALDANQLNFPVEYGPKVSAIRHGVCGFDVEVAYFQVDGFTGQGMLPGTSRMVTDMADTSFTVSNGTDRYTSALYNGELNLRRQANEWLTLVAGFRAIELDERYHGMGTDFGNPTLTDFLSTATFNHLYGGQIGADAEVFNLGGPLQINVLCKAGVFGNTAEQNYQLAPSGIITDSLATRSCSQTSFMGEAGVVATYALTKRLAFRASLDTLWLTGVALAPEQINSVNLRRRTDVVNTSGGVFYYGGGLGMEYRF
jgi:hypothetical protein